MAPSWTAAGVAWAADVLAHQDVHDELERLRPWLGEGVELTEDRKLLLLGAGLRLPVEGDPWRVVHPDEFELRMLRTVARYRAGGEGWPVEAQRLALLMDRRLRDLGVVRRRYRDACAVLGISMADAVDRWPRDRRWWWPAEVPPRPSWTTGGRDDRPWGEKPVVWLPDYDGPPDPLGLGESWEPGELLIVSGGLVVEAWGWRPQRSAIRAEPLPAADPDGQELRQYIDQGLRGLDDFLRWDGQA